MKNFCYKILTGALLLMGTGALLGAESDKESLAWLAKIKEVYAKSPLSIHMNMDMSMETQGVSMSMVMKGTMGYLDPKHMRGELALNTKMPQGEMDMNMFMVLEDETMWMKVNSPMLGGEQIMKMSLETMNNMNGMNTLGISQTDMMDPSKMMENISKVAGLSFGGIKDGKVLINGKMTKEVLDMMSGAIDGVGSEAGGSLNIVLDEKNIFPMEVSMVLGEKPLIHMSFTDLKFLKKEDLPEDYFKFTVPEGVPVMDMDTMMKQQQ